MKKILFSLLILVVGSWAFAQGGPGGGPGMMGGEGMMGQGPHDPARFEKHKKMMLEEIDSRIASAQALKSCISAAKAQEDIQKCRREEQEKMKKHQEEMQAKMKDQKKEAIDDRIKKLQEEKSKLEQKK